MYSCSFWSNKPCSKFNASTFQPYILSLLYNPWLFKDKSICCGDNLYPHVPVDKVYKHMRKRAQSMPCEHVVVYCVSCIKAMHNGGKKPLYIVDLLFNEATEIQESDVVKWHEQLNEYIEQH